MFRYIEFLSYRQVDHNSVMRYRSVDPLVEDIDFDIRRPRNSVVDDIESDERDRQRTQDSSEATDKRQVNSLDENFQGSSGVTGSVDKKSNNSRLINLTKISNQTKTGSKDVRVVEERPLYEVFYEGIQYWQC